MFLSHLFPTAARRGLPCVVACAASLVHSAPAPSSGASITHLSPVTVTGTREKAPLSETPASIGAIAADAIRETAPLHPAQLLGQIPGVAVAVTNGEGHTTAIRQPFTTSPVYLFLEDGVPVRATGFFNHNSLYEVNLPMAGGIEVIRGPGTALYGSDAIGGIVNVLSRAPLAERRAALSAEAGAFGTWRFFASGGGAVSEHGAVQLDVNLTHTDGWRERTAYDRQSANLRVDHDFGDAGTLKTIVGYSKIEQQTGANSPLPLADYLQSPTRNLQPIAFRNVSAMRISAEYERSLGTGRMSLVPYFRDNAMELNGTFNLSSDPRLETTHNVSYGLLGKWRKNFSTWRTRLITGFDLDYSPGTRREDNLLVTRSGSGASTEYRDYQLGTRIYDYRVVFTSLSPYVHAEVSPLAALRLTAGLRQDMLRYELENRLPAGAVSASVHGATRFYGQLEGNRTSFDRVSPKLGATYALGAHTHAYASYNSGFRAPSESQLYRAGNETNVENALARARLQLGLKPIKAMQAELGVRGHVAQTVSYNLAVYELTKRDDLLSQRDLTTNVSTSVNAGRTEHRGVEVGIGAPLAARVRLDVAFSYARHRYVNWLTGTANHSGNEIEAAPRVLANTRLTWRPVKSAMLQLEWVRVGSYWLEPSNAARFGKYGGHDLWHLRANHALTSRVSLSARVINLLDKRFADSAGVTSNTAVFSPGLPRAFYGGVEVRW